MMFADTLQDFAVPVADFRWGSKRQKAKAEARGCTHATRTRYIGWDLRYLPASYRKAIDALGYDMHVLGGTTYDHQVVGFTPRPALKG